MEYKILPKPTKQYQRSISESAHNERAFVDLLNKEMEELLKNIATNSKEVENGKERN